MTEKIQCPHCGKLYSKYGIKNHIKLAHTEEGQEYLKNRKDTFGESRGWAKGKTKDTDESVRKIATSLSNNTGEQASFYGKHHTKEKKKQISKSMMIAHSEGRANNWQDSKKYHNASYPEKFFEQVIENEFEDKSCTREYRFGQYSIDFAWVDKKLAIEIDGSQHEYPKLKESDKKKDELLIKSGWKVLRIKWLEMFHDPKYYIQIAKDFIKG